MLLFLQLDLHALAKARRVLEELAKVRFLGLEDTHRADAIARL